jgi:hypothetical protein
LIAVIAKTSCPELILVEGGAGALPHRLWNVRLGDEGHCRAHLEGRTSAIAVEQALAPGVEAVQTLLVGTGGARVAGSGPRRRRSRGPSGPVLREQRLEPLDVALLSRGREALEQPAKWPSGLRLLKPDDVRVVYEKRISAYALAMDGTALRMFGPWPMLTQYRAIARPSQGVLPTRAVML